MKEYTVKVWTVEESQDFGDTWAPMTNAVSTSFPDRDSAQKWCFDLYDAYQALGVKHEAGWILRVVAPK